MRRAARAALAFYGLSLVALSIAHAALPQRDGLLAITQVFAPHLFLPLVVAVPVALVGRWRTAGVLLAVAAVVGIVRFGPGLVSLPADAGAGTQVLHVTSWNLAAGEAAATVLLERLVESDADVVALQELRPEHVVAFERDARLGQQLPHRVLELDAGVLGVGLLSRYPVIASTSYRDPAQIVAVLDVGDGRTITVATAHPLPARIGFVAGVLPVAYDARERDNAIGVVRERVESDATGPLILFGDFNVTDREPGYATLTADLVDAHAAVGIGTGSTWRPAIADFLPFGVLRIDYVLAGNGARPLTAAVDCPTNAGDHCIVSSRVEIP